MHIGPNGHALLLALVASAGCSSAATDSGDTAPTSKPGGTSTVTADAKWSTQSLKGNVVVAAGVTLTINPGATITCAKGATITVLGTLKVAAKDNHAKLTCASWQGVVIAKGGTLDAEGLEIENADTGLRTNDGNAAGRFDYGAVRATASPWVLEANSKLSADHSTFEATGQSEIYGAFTGTFISYTKGAGDGILMGDNAAILSVEDSIFHGSGGTGDFLISQHGASMHVAYTTIEGAHCAFHFDDIGAFEIDHVTSKDTQWGAMLYGSRAKSTITASNMIGAARNIDVQNANGDIQIAQSYFESTNTTKNSYTGSMPKVTGAVNSAVSGAAPRGTPGM